jgi:hypothetical protein
VQALLMSNTILLVFEGEDVEKQLFNSIKKYFFTSSNRKSIIRGTFKGEIYQLWENIKDDDNIDIIEVLKERPDTDINDIKRNDVSEIHLFFDHEGHSHLKKMSTEEYNKMINDLLDTFNNETEHGKLWISYPMIEAIKHCKDDPANCFKDTHLEISDNVNYKNHVNETSNFLDIKEYTEKTWHYLSMINIQRTYRLITNKYNKISDYQTIKHWFEGNAIIKQIQEKQYEKFILPKNEVVALSPFPLFIISYYGEKYFNQCKRELFTKNCCFSCYK